MSVSQHVPGLHSSFSNRIAHFKEDQSVLNIADVISLKQSASDMFYMRELFGPWVWRRETGIFAC